MDFDVLNETITPNNTNVLTLAGQAVELPAGSTGNRPGGVADGALRYNTDTNLVEGLYGGTWKSSSDWSLVTNSPTTLSGYGITDAVSNEFGTPGIIQDTQSNRPVAGNLGLLFIDTTNDLIQRDTGSNWVTVGTTNVLKNIPSPTPTYKTIQDFVNIVGSRGTFSGGTITNNGDGTIAVSGGSGSIRATDAPNTDLYFFNWNTVSSLSLTNNNNNYVYIFYNSGSPTVIAQTTETFDKRYILLGLVYRAGTTLFINDKTNLKYNETFSGIITRLQKTSPWARESGAIISEPAGLRLAITSGIFWQGIETFSTPSLNTNTSDTFTYWYRTGSTWTSVLNQTTTNNSQYNDTATGLASLSSNRFTNNWVLLTVDGQLHVVYGTENSNNLGTVQAADVPTLPPNIALYGFLVGRVIIRQGQSTFVQIDSVFTQPYSIVPVTSHMELADLQGGIAGEYFHFASAEHTNLSNLASVASTGLITLTGTNTYTSRFIAGTAGNITVTNGDGVNSNPTINLATVGTSGTYGQVTTDAFGRVTSGGTNAVATGGTGLTALGTANQVLGVNTGGTALEYKTITAGSGIAITPTAGSITIAATGGSGTVTSVAVTGSTGLTVGGSPITTTGTITLTLDTGLQNLASLATTGMVVASGTDTWITRTLTGTTNQITITNGTGVAGNPTFAIATNPVLPGTTNVVVPTGTTAQETGTTDGALRYNTTTTTMRMRTAGAWRDVGTVTSVAATAPAAGFTITGSPITSSGTLTFALSDDLAAVEGLATTGITTRTATNTWTTRTVTGTAGNITVTNGDGVAGNPTIDLVTAGTAGTYGSATQVPVFTTDAFGRITSVTNTAITFPVTSVFGRTGAVVAAEGDYSLTQLSDVTLTVPTNGQVLRYNGTQWVNGTDFTGTVTSVDASGGTTGLTFSGGPITTSGTLTLAGTLAVTNGGTGQTTYTDGQLLIGNSTGNTLTKSTLTPGTAISITNGAGSITVTNTGVTSLAGTAGNVTVSAATGAVTINLATAGTAGTYATVTTDAFGRVTSGVAIQTTATGGTGLTTIGTSNQVLGVNTGGTALEYKTITAGTGITVTPAAGSITIAATNTGTVTSVAVTGSTGLTVGGSPITTSGTITLTLGTELQGLSGLNTNGMITRTGAGTYASRTITGTAGNITVTNGDGVAGNPTINLATAGTAGTYGQVTTDAFGRVTSGGTNTIANGGTGLTTTPTNGQLLIGNGTGYALSTITAGTGISVTNGAGSITINATNNGTVTSVAATAPAAGFTITGSPITSSGTLVFALSDDLAAVEGLATTGIAIRTATNTWTTRTITGTAGNITITNGDGVAGNPTINLATAGTAGTYATVTTDAFGRVTSGVATQTTTTGGTGLTTIGTANQVLGVNTGGTALEYKTITAGANITITPAAGSITIAAAGGSGTPGGVNTNVQYNNAGAFGGSNAFNFVSGANPRVDILGTALTTQLTVGGTNQPNNASLYIENFGDTTSEGIRCYFRRTAAGSSAWITYDYDQASPNIRLTDEDDDSPYIQFNTVGTGTYASPLYTSAFGARGANAARTGGNSAGFAWLIGSNVVPATMWTAGNYPTFAVMELDSQWLRIPTGTTAQRPGTPAVGMIRYNTTTGIPEAYYNTTWNTWDVANGSNTQVQYNSNGQLAGATRVSIDDNDLLLAVNDTPTTPTGTNVKIFGRSIASRIMPAFVGPSGLDTTVQPLLARNKVGYWNPPGNSTTVPGVFGFTALTTVGTATARNVAVTNTLTRMRRLGYVSGNPAGSLASARVPVAQFTTGNATVPGGFFWVTRFGISDTSLVSGARMFVGMSSSTAAATNVEPNTLTNSVGVAQLSTDGTQLYIVYGGSVAQTAIALGAANFPISLSIPYEIALFAPPSTAGTVYWQVTNLTNNTFTSGTITGGTTVIPGSSTLLTTQIWRTNNASTGVVGIDICSIYVETDN